jgi:hypothetical protein
MGSGKYSSLALLPNLFLFIFQRVIRMWTTGALLSLKNVQLKWNTLYIEAVGILSANMC